MPTGPRGQKRPADAIARAVMVGKIATGELPDTLTLSDKASQSAGGRARAVKLTSDTRSEIAKKAARARWGND